MALTRLGFRSLVAWLLEQLLERRITLSSSDSMNGLGPLERVMV
jgi:hypothetical protein